jgi:CheY-like chemotaxis protein
MSRNILVVEDNKDLAQLLALHLRDLSYEVDLAFNGDDGWAQITSQSYHISILSTLSAPWAPARRSAFSSPSNPLSECFVFATKNTKIATKDLPGFLLPNLFVSFLNRLAEHINVQRFLQVGKSAQLHT